MNDISDVSSRALVTLPKLTDPTLTGFTLTGSTKAHGWNERYFGREPWTEGLNVLDVQYSV